MTQEFIPLPQPLGEDWKSWAASLVQVLDSALRRFDSTLDYMNLYDEEGRRIVGPEGVYPDADEVIPATKIKEEDGKHFAVEPGADKTENNSQPVSWLTDAEVLQGQLVARGLIALWSGSVDSIPTGWVLCDGTKGTPDLRDKFILGAGTVDPGTEGGTKSHTLNPSDLMPSHTHDYEDASYTLNKTIGTAASGSGVTVVTDVTLSETLPTKTTQAAGSGTGVTLDNQPQYYALAFIMFQG